MKSRRREAAFGAFTGLSDYSPVMRALSPRHVVWFYLLCMTRQLCWTAAACVEQPLCVSSPTSHPSFTYDSSLIYTGLADCLAHCEALGPACPSMMFYYVNGVTCWVFDSVVEGTVDCLDTSWHSETLRSDDYGWPSLWNCPTFQCASGYSACFSNGCCDIDSDCTCDDVCTPGSYQEELGCSYVVQDECSAGQANCDAMATCTNTEASFACTCNTGFGGSGISCADLNECSDGSENCDPNNSVCSNTVGSFTCACNAGYTTADSGVTCVDVDECSDGVDDCDKKAQCENTVGSFTCACDAGYSGSGVSCAACAAGTFAEVSGQAKCSECGAGEYQNETAATFCFTCPTNTMSPTSSDELTDCICNIGTAGTGALLRTQPGVACYPTFNSSQCFSENVSLSSVCAADAIHVRGCADSRFGFETGVMRSAAGGSLYEAVASCEAFWGFLCRALGGAPSSSFECDLYCLLVSRGLRQTLENECVADAECSVDALQGESVYPLALGADTVCASDVRYALFASCTVPAGAEAPFAAAVEGLLSNQQSNASCALRGAAADESARTGQPVPAPEWLSGEECAGATDCAVACFASGFEVRRQGEGVSLSSIYAGGCDCSVKGFFSGSITYSGAPQLLAANAAGDRVLAVPLKAVNQILANFSVASSASHCSFLWDLGAGSLLGLPVADELQYTSESELAFVGFDETLSAAGTLRRRAGAAGSGHGAQGPWRRLVATPAAECPTEAGDCRFECLAGGFAVSAFGSLVRVTPRYDADACDCTLVFPGGKMDGSLVAGETAEVRFPAAMDLLEGGGVDPGGLVDVALLPRADGMRLEFSPPASRCSYIVGVEVGLLLGLGITEEERQALLDAAAEAAAAAAASDENATQLVNATEADGEGFFAVSVEEAEAAAEVVSVAVAASVAASVAAAVAGSVAGAVAGSVGAGAAGGAAGGAGGGVAGSQSAKGSSQAAVEMVVQCGNVALLSRVGGSGVLPEAASALGSGLSWANGHPPVNAWAAVRKGDFSTTYLRRSAGTGRRAKGGTGGGDGGGFEGSEGAVQGCGAARDSSRELVGTLVLVAAVVAAVSLVRVGLNRLVQWLRVRNGKDAGEEVVVFPLWESQVIVIFFLGLAESAAEAMASGCLFYEIAGAVVAALLLFFAAWLAFLVALVLRQQLAVWRPCSWEQVKQDCGSELSGWSKMKLVGRIRHAYAAWLIVKQRGQWEAQEDKEDSLAAKLFGKRLSDRISSLFDGYVGAGSWFQFFVLARAFASALIIVCVLTPTVNAALLVTINATDACLLLWVRPDLDWAVLYLNTWRALCNLGSVSTALAFIEGWLPTDLFASVFFFVQTLSIVPYAVFSALEPLAQLFEGLAGVLSYCQCSWRILPEGFVSRDLAAGVTAAATAAAIVAANDDNLHQSALAAIDDDDDEERGTAQKSERAAAHALAAGRKKSSSKKSSKKGGTIHPFLQGSNDPQLSPLHSARHRVGPEPSKLQEVYPASTKGKVRRRGSSQVRVAWAETPTSITQAKSDNAGGPAAPKPKSKPAKNRRRRPSL